MNDIYTNTNIIKILHYGTTNIVGCYHVPHCVQVTVHWFRFIETWRHFSHPWSQGTQERSSVCKCEKNKWMKREWVRVEGGGGRPRYTIFLPKMSNLSVSIFQCVLPCHWHLAHLLPLSLQVLQLLLQHNFIFSRFMLHQQFSCPSHCILTWQSWTQLLLKSLWKLNNR